MPERRLDAVCVVQLLGRLSQRVRADGAEYAGHWALLRQCLLWNLRTLRKHCEHVLLQRVRPRVLTLLARPKARWLRLVALYP